MTVVEFEELLREALSPVGAWVRFSEVVDFLEMCAARDLVVLTVHAGHEFEGGRRVDACFRIERGSMSSREAKEYFLAEIRKSWQAKMIYNVFV